MAEPSVSWHGKHRPHTYFLPKELARLECPEVDFINTHTHVALQIADD
eukprot:COSAG06_NODE_26502_length_613_cov_1.295720_1_plen_47_part_10